MYTFKSALGGTSTSTNRVSATEQLNFKYQPAGGRKFFAIDAPGVDKYGYRKSSSTSAYYASNFTSTLKKGDVSCTVRWAVTVTVNNGRMTGGTFHAFHIPLP
jgi:hypothetical protein